MRGVYTEKSIEYIDGSVQNRIKTNKIGRNYKIRYLSDFTISLLQKYIADNNIPVNSLLFNYNKRNWIETRSIK